MTAVIRQTSRCGSPPSSISFVIEIPLYLPEHIRASKTPVGMVFAHNAFTVQFLFERLPLYIVCAVSGGGLRWRTRSSDRWGCFAIAAWIVGAVCSVLSTTASTRCSIN